MSLIRRLRSRRPAYPTGFRLCWYEAFANAHVVAPIGLHLCIRYAERLYRWVEYRASLALQDGTPKTVRYCSFGHWLPRLRWVEGDNIAAIPGHGLCWEERPEEGIWGRYTAPIGLNLVYALIRRAALEVQVRAP